MPPATSTSLPAAPSTVPLSGTGQQAVPPTSTPVHPRRATATPAPVATLTGLVSGAEAGPSAVHPVTPRPTETATPTLSPRRGTTGAPADPASARHSAVAPVALPQLPDTGYGPQSAARDPQESGILLGGVLVGLLALAGGWLGSLRRRSRSR